MLRVLIAALALVTAIPESASMQALPGPLPPDPLTPVADQGPSQEPRPAPPRPGAPGEPQAPPPPPRAAQPPPAAVPTPAPPRRMRGRDFNVQVELTIADHIGNAPPEKRVVSMMIADGAFGRIRSIADASIAVLNVDARPEILENDRLVVEITIEYKPLGPEGAGAAKRPAPLNEQLTVILQSGKPLLVSQAADPLNDRKMTVEVRASILK